MNERQAFTPVLSRISCAPRALTKPGALPPTQDERPANKDTHMSDQAPSGEPTSAPATAAEAAPAAAPVGDSRPIGAFGTAKGSGLSRGKRASVPAAAPAASSASTGTYKPTSVEVITPVREYTNPFEAPKPAEPAPAPVAAEPIAPSPAPEAAPAPAPVSLAANSPVTTASEPPAATAPAAGEMFPFNEGDKKPAHAIPAEVIQPPVEKAEIKILPPAEAKRPAVSWGQGTNDEDTRPERDPRPTFQPDRRERKFEPRQPRSQEQREPRRESSFEQRGPVPAPANKAPAPAPEKSSGGFFGWLKGLFGGKSAETPAPQGEQRQGGREGGEFHRRRHRGGRGRGGYQGDNRGGPRPEGQQGGEGFRSQGQGGEQQEGERRFEGGGGRRRRRGGRGRFRDDRGPRPEGQQGGGAI